MKGTLLILALAFSGIAKATTYSTSIPRFAQVSEGVYRGGRPRPNDMTFLKAMEIKTDISLQGGDLKNPGFEDLIRWMEPGEIPENIAQEKKLAEQLQIQFINLPLNSLKPITEEEDAAIDDLLKRMSDPAAQPVFVHCEHGVDRTGLVIALYRVRYQKWDVRTAYHEWLDAGHGGLSSIFTGDLDTYYFNKVKEFALMTGM